MINTVDVLKIIILNNSWLLVDLSILFKLPILGNRKITYGSIPHYKLKINMRVLVRAMVSTVADNKMVNDPNFLKKIEEYVKKFNCEASYFTEVNGNRTLVFVLNLPSSDMIPAIAEPLFQGFEANVETHPAMNLDDLKTAISRLP